MAEVEEQKVFMNYDKKQGEGFQKVIDDLLTEADYISDSLKAGHLPEGVAEILKKTSS